MTAPMSEPTSPLVFCDAERPSVPFDGGASYRVLIGDDNGAGIAVRTGVQTSQPGYATPEHSHPYAEVITVLSGRGEAWLAGQPARLYSNSPNGPVGCTRPASPDEPDGA